MKKDILVFGTSKKSILDQMKKMVFDGEFKDIEKYVLTPSPRFYTRDGFGYFGYFDVERIRGKEFLRAYVDDRVEWKIIEDCILPVLRGSYGDESDIEYF